MMISEEQARIAAELGVTSAFDPEVEIARRVNFLAHYARSAQAHTLVLGISGGVDSTVTGRLCQLAVEALRTEGSQIRFIAMRLPYGVQVDEADAQRALAFIDADEALTVDIKPAADAMLERTKAAGMQLKDEWYEDFVLGNIKARQRMIAQYAVAGATSGLVVGTDHAAEALMGFFTKYGDGGCDVAPLSGLTKRRVRALAHALGADAMLVSKIPTADLETLRPQRADEAALGVTYQAIDDFLEGHRIDGATEKIILDTYRRTAHKRALPAFPSPAQP